MIFPHNFLLVQINVWISAISFHAYADISFEETSDVSTGPLVHKKDIYYCYCYFIFFANNALLNYNFGEHVDLV